MTDLRKVLLPMFTVAFCFAGCAASPEREQRQQEIEADINEILALPLDEKEFGTTQRCLSSHDYQSMHPLDEKHVLIEGSRDRLWINTLSTRCGGLRRDDILIVKHYTGTQICESDRFTVAERTQSPSTWGTGMHCTLGEFQPVTPDQVAEIEALVKESQRH